MIYRPFRDVELSLLGFGAMRLPTLPNGEINREETFKMVDTAIQNGINYFDTAQPYHGGMSELVLGEALKRHKREEFFLATKFPGHQIFSSYDPKAVFEGQLKKCGVEYFDFYLLHNVYEHSIGVYTDPKWGIIDYFLEQKKQGKIRYLGFSTHADTETLKAFLEQYGKDMDFCQIQLNYLDWTLQDAEGKYELLKQHNMPIFVMEPVRGGKLVHLPKEEMESLQALRPEASAVEWCFRFLETLPRVNMVLSGMSSMAQLEDNLRTFKQKKPLSEQELSALFSVAESMKGGVPCTACGYCKEGCPMGLDIPKMLSTLNDIQFSPSVNSTMWIEFSPEDKKPSACISCGKCARVCPQKIDIPKELLKLADKLKAMPSWAAISKEREEIQRKWAEKS